MLWRTYLGATHMEDIPFVMAVMGGLLIVGLSAYVLAWRNPREPD